MLTHKKFLVLFQMLPCHGFLDSCIKLFFTQVFFIAVVMDEQNFLVPTCIRLVPFACTLVAFTIEWLIIPCVFATWGLFSLRESWLEGKLGGTRGASTLCCWSSGWRLLVGEVRLWLVVLDVLLHLALGLGCDVHKLNHVVVPLELGDALDRMVFKPLRKRAIVCSSRSSMLARIMLSSICLKYSSTVFFP